MRIKNVVFRPSFVIVLSFLFFSFCSSKQTKKDDSLVTTIAPVVATDGDATLTVQKDLSVELLDGKLVNWPPIDKDSVKVPVGKHTLSCSYRITKTTRFVTTQKSARNILVEADFEKDKNYLLQYNLNNNDVQLSLQEQEVSNSEQSDEKTEEETESDNNEAEKKNS